MPVNEELDTSTEDDDLTSRARKLSKPKADTFVRFKMKERSNKATALPKQAKWTGSNRNWVNVLVDGDKKPSSIIGIRLQERKK